MLTVVTGGTGHIGGNLVRMLLAEGQAGPLHDLEGRPGYRGAGRS